MSIDFSDWQNVVEEVIAPEFKYKTKRSLYAHIEDSIIEGKSPRDIGREVAKLVGEIEVNAIDHEPDLGKIVKLTELDIASDVEIYTSMVEDSSNKVRK